MKRRKLFVWEFQPDYYPGLIVAMAYTVEEARKLVIAADGFDSVIEAIEREPRIFDQPIAFVNWGGG